MSVFEFSTRGLKVKDKMMLSVKMGKMLSRTASEHKQQIIARRILEVNQEIIHEVGLKRYRELMAQCQT